MGSFSNFLDAVNSIIEDGKKREIIHLFTEEDKMESNHIRLNNREVVNFGSCSYLGLEFDKRLKAGAIEAVSKFGTQFSSSRSYVSLGLYAELEQLFNHIFEANCIVTPTTTLGHISAIPVLVKDEDAVILDHQVHSSVQTAVSLLKPRGIHVELVRHNKMDDLENKIIQLRTKHKRIWYMADGIYSMYGDTCPMSDIERLLKKYKQFHAYIDDAHGMSWYGKSGKGYVLSQMKSHERMVVVASLAKSFAVGGGVLILPNKSTENKIRNCGGPLIFSGPLQPANLGAAIASAKIHLSPEIKYYQQELWDNIKYTKRMIADLDLPCVSLSDSPVFFIGVSLPKIAYGAIERLVNKGHYVNLGIYPAVPMKNTGIRFTITRLHTKAQIKALLQDMKTILNAVIEEHDFSYEKIYKAFRREMKPRLNAAIKTATNQQLSIHLYQNVNQVDKELWDSLFHSKGIINHNALVLLERTFSNNNKREHNWEFEYIIIKDEQQKPVLATFLTLSLNKDDMMSSREVSGEIELMRQADPYYLTSEILSVGTPLTEGEQLYLDRTHPLWKIALNQLLEVISKKQSERKINQVVIRDFENPDAELEKLFIDNGFLKYQLPDNNYIDNFDWNDMSEFRQLLSKKSYSNFKREVKRNIDKFDVRINEHPSNQDIQHWYNLYLNVKNNNVSVNTFALPSKLFATMANDKDWVTIELFPKTEYALPKYDNKSVAVVFIQKNGSTANAAIAGINYEYQKAYRCYLCLVYQIVLWTKSNNFDRLNLGYTADREKRKVGAKQSSVFSFMQIQDDFNMKVIAQTSAKAKFTAV